MLFIALNISTVYQLTCLLSWHWHKNLCNHLCSNAASKETNTGLQFTLMALIFQRSILNVYNHENTALQRFPGKLCFHARKLTGSTWKQSNSQFLCNRFVQQQNWQKQINPISCPQYVPNIDLFTLYPNQSKSMKVKFDQLSNSVTI